MQTQLQVGPPKGPQQKVQKFTRRQWIIAGSIATATLVITVLESLSSASIISPILANIISTASGVLGAAFALWALLFSGNQPAPMVLTQPQPASPSLGSNSFRGLVSFHPLIDPKTIQQREMVVRTTYRMLTQPNNTCIVLTGIAGVGKSTIAALVLRYAEEQRQASKNFFTVEPIWLTIDQFVTIAEITGNLCEILGKPQPDFGNLSPQNQAVVFFRILNTVDQSRLIILDQFDNLLDWQTGKALPGRLGIGEWLDALNSQQLARSRILLTSRILPRGTRAAPSTYMCAYEIKGLETMEGIELLKNSDVKANDKELEEAVSRCEGHAFALVHLAALLKYNSSLNLNILLNYPLYAHLWSGDIAHNLLDYIYNEQMVELQRLVLRAFSTYREAVLLEGVQVLLSSGTDLPEAQFLSAFSALLAQHMLQAAGEGSYQLHSIVASYASDQFVEQERRAAHARAAVYYVRRAETSVPVREKRHRIRDVHDYIEATWHFCQAQQWRQAYDLMQQTGMFADLRRWGENALLLELCQLLLPLDKWQPKPPVAAHFYTNLGRLYNDLGQHQQACIYYEQALTISRQICDGKREGVAHNNLGRSYKALGNLAKAQTCFEQALTVCKRVEDRGGEATTLNNLGSLVLALGKVEEAQAYYQRALSIFRSDVQYPAGEARALNGSGQVFATLGQIEQAHQTYSRALNLYQKIGDRRGESQVLNNLGNIALQLEHAQEARVDFEQALSIRKELGNPWTLAITFNDLGQACHMQGRYEEALQCYKKALRLFREEKDQRQKGKTLLNLGILYQEQGRDEVALTCFLLANNNHEHVKIHIQKLREKIGEDPFALILERIEPHASEILEQALRDETVIGGPHE